MLHLAYFLPLVRRRRGTRQIAEALATNQSKELS
jgi:hypothetical protein